MVGGGQRGSDWVHNGGDYATNENGGRPPPHFEETLRGKIKEKSESFGWGLPPTPSPL